MNNDAFVKIHMVKAVLEKAHPLIRQTLLEDPKFSKKYGFKTDAVLSFGDSKVSIKRSTLFTAIRKVLSTKSDVIISDINDNEWKLILTNKNEGPPTLSICDESQRLNLPDFSVLSSDRDIRIKSLELFCSNVNLTLAEKNEWYKILFERSLEDDEVDEFRSDFHFTPVHFAQSIQMEIKRGESSVQSLIPTSRKYFERLVGVYGGSKSIKDYAEGSAKKVICELFEWNPYDGFLFSLFLASHNFITCEIPIDKIDSDALLKAYRFIEDYGDKISQLGAVEIGLSQISQNPDLEPYLIRITEKIRDDKVDEHNSEFTLLSALFVLVEGELSLNRILSDTPPFYRRLASIAHASLIHRQINILGGIDIKSFSDWAFNARAEQFYFQNLADMRREPRWNPDLSMASQIKADFFGRLMISAEKHKKNISESKIYKHILGDGPDSLVKLSELPLPYLPGPLEGEETSPNPLPPELAEAVENQLKSEEVGPESFIALVNTALVFRVEKQQAELAAKALRLGNHRLANVQNQPQLLVILNGVASVAAVTRSKTLANELRILVRKYKVDPAYTLSIDEVLRICLVAAASHSDLDEWRDFLGDWLNELAFAKFKNKEGESFHSHLKCLLHSVPELWLTCGKAQAAIVAYNKSINDH